MDIIAPSTAPRIILLLSPMLLSRSEIPVFIMPMNGLIAHITTAMIPSPARGYMSTGLTPLSAFGMRSQSFSSPSISKPPANPANSAPRKPEGIAPCPLIFANVEPVEAR